MAWPTATIVTTQMDAAADDPSQARAEIKQMADNVNAIKDAKGAASGIAELDSGGKVPLAQLAAMPANKGGTDQTSYSVGDILYASAAGTLSKLAASTANYVLTSNGPGVAPSWQTPSGGFASGTRMPFNQTAAPTGWTKDTTFNDSIMRIVSGAVGNGGSAAFSTFNGQSATGGHTLTLAEIPSHNHPVYHNTGSTTGASQASVSVANTAVSSNTGIAGGDGAHSHPLTHNIKYNDFIIAEKD